MFQNENITCIRHMVEEYRSKAKKVMEVNLLLHCLRGKNLIIVFLAPLDKM